MRRRSLLGVIAAMISAPAFASAAREPGKLVIGFLSIGSAGPFASFVAAFLQGLRGTGYVDGKNVSIEYRWANGDVERLPTLTADLVSRKVDVIATSGGVLVALVAKRLTDNELGDFRQL